MKSFLSMFSKIKVNVNSYIGMRGAAMFTGRIPRKKVKGRNFSYEFGRVPKEIQSKIDIAIKEILKGGMNTPPFNYYFKLFD